MTIDDAIVEEQMMRLEFLDQLAVEGDQVRAG